MVEFFKKNERKKGIYQKRTGESDESFSCYLLEINNFQ
jgi:hypothetical protein